MKQVEAIKFLDLVAPHSELKQELTAVFTAALDTAGFIGGPLLDGFERDFAQFCDAQCCVGVANGTDALRFAMIAAGIQIVDRDRSQPAQLLIDPHRSLHRV